MKVLMLSLNTFPYPPSRGAAEGRTFNLIKYLYLKSYEVTVVTHQLDHVKDEDIAALEPWVKRLEILPSANRPEPGKTLLSRLGQAKRLGQFMATGTPPNVSHRYSLPVQACVDSLVQTGDYDVLVCEHSVNEMYVRSQWRQHLRTVVDIHSSVYGWVKNHLEAGASENPARDRLYLPLLARYEKRYCRKFSTLIATTRDEYTLLQSLVPDAQIDIVSNGVDLETFTYRPHDPGGQRLIFLGAMDSSHNIDAAEFIARDIFPKVRERYPQATLSLVGARPVKEVQALQDLPGIEVTGRVPSMTDYLHQSTVCVVPLRAGLGIKTKTLESMATGIPIVASDRGLEGLTIDEPGIPRRALRANTVEAFVTAISQLFEDPSLRAELSQNERQMIETEYTWEFAGQRYEQALAGTKIGK